MRANYSDKAIKSSRFDASFWRISCLGLICFVFVPFHVLIRHVLKQGFPTFLLPCTPSAIRQMSMYPFSILTDEHVPLKCHMTKYFVMTIHRYNNKHIMFFLNNINW